MKISNQHKASFFNKKNTKRSAFAFSITCHFHPHLSSLSGSSVDGRKLQSDTFTEIGRGIGQRLDDLILPLAHRAREPEAVVRADPVEHSGWGCDGRAFAKVHKVGKEGAGRCGGRRCVAKMPVDGVEVDLALAGL